MDYLQNHIFCRDSVWGDAYSCRHLVSFSSYEEHNKDDWNNIIDQEAELAVDRFRYELAKRYRPNYTEDELKSESEVWVPNLKPHVLSWLNNNVEDRNNKDSPKGWAIGSCQYRLRNTYDFSVFFHRKNDAMAFIREFSQHKKPIHYYQYFSDVRKELDLTTGKYVHM